VIAPLKTRITAHCVAYGVRFRIQADSEALMNRLVAVLPPGWRSTAAPVQRTYSLVTMPGAGSRTRRVYLARADARVLARTPDVRVALAALEGAIQLFIAEYANRRVFVHAGVVAWRGRGILIPGRSFSGKSTLVAAFVRAGARYYSDEYAVIDPRGRVHPYLKPLSLRTTGRRWPQRWSAEAVGGREGRTPVPVGVILALRYRPAARWRPRRLSPGHSALRLLAHAVPARRRPELVLPILSRVVVGATCWAGVRGEAEEVVQRVLRKT